jgi:hypothetical protein
MVDSAFAFRVAEHKFRDSFSLFKKVILQVCHGEVFLLEGSTARTTKRPTRVAPGSFGLFSYACGVGSAQEPEEVEAAGLGTQCRRLMSPVGW